jgi:6-phosphogluconolactonase
MVMSKNVIDDSGINEVFIEDNTTRLARKGADIFSGSAKESVFNKGSFVVAVSGGSTPRAMHRMLGEEPFVSEIPWEKTHIFWVDERCVPFSDSASNYGAFKSDLIGRAPIPSYHIHPMPAEDVPSDGALRYEEELLSFFQLKEGQFPVFDLLMLGIGKDGHTASLFPGSRALEEKKRLVVPVKGGNPYVYRLTLTLPVLKMARRVVFLVSGKGKAGTVEAILERKDENLPAGRVRPSDGRLIWLLDREAASLLHRR